MYPIKPMSSDLNILVSHGEKDISIDPKIYPDSNPRLNINKFVGEGKILILLVCHSGSSKLTPFKNSISSIAKKYITRGYKAVVAPYWSLHPIIVPVWLSEFLSVIDQGDEIVYAVHKANLKIHEIYPTIAASACMHLYGDPHIELTH